MKTLKKIDFFFREIVDPYAQENFWRLKNILEDFGKTENQGPPGPPGPPGPAAPPPTAVPSLTSVFNTDVGTNVKDLVYVNGNNTVTKLLNNAIATIPNGIFGVGIAKPSPLQIEVLFIGKIGGYSGFITGLPLFVSPTGIPTHTVPVTGIVQQIGRAISSTEFLVQILQPMGRS